MGACIFPRVFAEHKSQNSLKFEQSEMAKMKRSAQYFEELEMAV